MAEGLPSKSLGPLLRRPVGRLGIIFLTLIVATAPAVLFFDPADLVPRRGHIPREPLGIYQLFSDDVAYVAGSRTWPKTVSNLFVPHNVHIVPAWRIVTWGLVALAGSLERLPEVLAVASYAILVAVMLLCGRLVARETGNTFLAFAAMSVLGTTSLMLTPGTWYSAGQPLWAGFGILATLWYAQSYRRSGRVRALLPAAVSAPLAGWFWTMGHMAGPAAALYLWVDGRRRCRLAALVPLGATITAVALGYSLAARPIDSTISFHGRSVKQAFHPIQGALNTGQAIAENLVFGNLGLIVQTTPAQGAILTVALLLLWASRRGNGLARSITSSELDQAIGEPRPRSVPFGSLECCGVALVLGTYLVEWAFRGYEEFQQLRTLNLRFIVPWYDAIPQIGLVLAAAGSWLARTQSCAEPRCRVKAIPLNWLGSVGVGALVVGMIVLNRPRVDALVRATVPPLLPSERSLYPIPRLQTMRANALISMRTEWQRSYLRALDSAEARARRMGISRDAIHAALGHPWVPGSVGSLRPELYDLYDAIGLLDLPEHGPAVSPATVRAALGEFFVLHDEPRPGWIAPREPWPPPEESVSAR